MRVTRGESVCRLKESEMPVRNVVTRSSRKFHGYFPSKKLNRMVGFESILEKKVIGILEGSQEVVSYEEQPEVIYFHVDGKQKKYYPDFAVTLLDEELVYVEVKPYEMLMTAKLTKKYQIIMDVYNHRGHKFYFITDRELSKSFASFRDLLGNTQLKMEVKNATFLL